MESAEPLHVVVFLAGGVGGWCLLTSTPKGMNHGHEVWRNAEQGRRRLVSLPRARDRGIPPARLTPIIPRARREQERKEGQREEWIQQEFFVAFTAALCVVLLWRLC